MVKEAAKESMRNEVSGWQEEFAMMWNQAAGSFKRKDTCFRAEQYIRGLLGSAKRKNSWQMAEDAGEDTPCNMQHTLDRAVWDADQVRDETRRYAASHLLAPGESGVLIVDETGFLKKGDKSVGVQRQYTGTAGRIENSQAGVFLVLSGSRGRALIDRELYLPKVWCDDQARCCEAKVPEGAKFATKPQLARRMLSRAFEDGLNPGWVLADAVYGNDSKFRQFLEDRHQPYVVAISANRLFWDGEQRKRIDTLAKELASDQWIRLSAGDGSKGPREYDWATRSIGKPAESGLRRIALFRRGIEKPEELAYFQCLAPASATIQDLSTAAGSRWSIECCFEAAKQETGLDEYEVRSWHGWYRHITLSMLALAFLSVVRAKTNAVESAKKRIRR